MNKRKYNFAVNECKSCSCYECYCNNRNFCFKDIIEKVVKDFPSRHFSQLNDEEKSKVNEIVINERN